MNFYNVFKKEIFQLKFESFNLSDVGFFLKYKRIIRIRKKSREIRFSIIKYV